MVGKERGGTLDGGQTRQAPAALSETRGLLGPLSSLIEGLCAKKQHEWYKSDLNVNLNGNANVNS